MYRRRRQFFEDLGNFNLKFLTCLEFSADPLGEFVQKVRPGFSADFRGVLGAYLSFLEGKGDAGLATCLARLPLSREEREQVKEYLLSLGACDCLTERKRCAEYKTVFSDLAEHGRAEEKKNGALSVKFSVYLGLLAVVLVI